MVLSKTRPSWKPDADDPTKVTLSCRDANVEVTATFADDPIGPDGPDWLDPSDTGNIQARSLLWSWSVPQVLLSMKPAPASTASSICPASPCPPTVSSWPSCCEHAGKPEPVSTASTATSTRAIPDAQKAARWAVEQDLTKDDADNNKFHPAFPSASWRTRLTWNAAKEKGLFDKTEE